MIALQHNALSAAASATAAVVLACSLCRTGEPDKIRCSQLVTVTYPGCSHELKVPCCSSAGYWAGTEPCTQLVQVTLPGCGHTVALPCSKAALAMLDPTCCTEKCGGLVSGCEHTCTSTCGKCMQLLLQGAASSGSSSGSGRSADGTTSTAGDGSAPKGLVELFLDKLQGHPGLLEVWTEWREKNAAAVKQERLAQLWLRFVKSEMSAGLGTRQCKVLGAAISSSSSSGSGAANSSSPASTWYDYIKWCGLLRMFCTVTDAEQLAGLWQNALLQPAHLSSSSSSGAASRPHMPCSRVCDRPLACGHSCEQNCHHGSSCGPCRKPCGIACQHTKCDHACAAYCAPCAEPCEWFCKHKGACLLPCGVPCDREPCNMRCSKPLSCGHRCPGLCGEVCLPHKFCVDPACMTKAPQHVKDRVSAGFTSLLVLCVCHNGSGCSIGSASPSRTAAVCSLLNGNRCSAVTAVSTCQTGFFSVAGAQNGSYACFTCSTAAGGGYDTVQGVWGLDRVRRQRRPPHLAVLRPPVQHLNPGWAHVYVRGL